MKVNEENIGKLFQQKLKDVEIQPDKAVWSAIEKQAGISTSWPLWAKLAVFVAASALLLSSYFIFRNNATTTEQPLVQKPNIEKESIRLTPITPTQTDSEKATEQKLQKEKSGEKKSSDKEVNKKPVVAKQPKKNAGKVASKANAGEKLVKNTSSTAVVKVEEKKSRPEDVVFEPQLVSFDDMENGADIVEDVDTGGVNNVASQDTSTIRFSEDPVVCFGEDAVLKVFGGVEYDWSNGSHMPSIKVSPVENSTYWVIVTDNNGRQQKHEFHVSVDRECSAVFVPSAFTPNGDGLNDEFKAEGQGIQQFEMVVFDRQGTIIFRANDINMSWDGTFKGELLPAVSYFYRINYMDAKGVAHELRGQVFLIR